MRSTSMTSHNISLKVGLPTCGATHIAGLDQLTKHATGRSTGSGTRLLICNGQGVKLKIAYPIRQARRIRSKPDVGIAW